MAQLQACSEDSSPLLPSSVATWTESSGHLLADEMCEDTPEKAPQPRFALRRVARHHSEIKGTRRVRHSLSRRHSICLGAPRASELSKLKHFSPHGTSESMSFEFTCSSQFREKYNSYIMGLEQQPRKRRHPLGVSLLSSLNPGQDQVSSEPLTKSVAASMDRSEECIYSDMNPGLCNACQKKNGCKVPQSFYLSDVLRHGNLNCSQLRSLFGSQDIGSALMDEDLSSAEESPRSRLGSAPSFRKRSSRKSSNSGDKKQSYTNRGSRIRDSFSPSGSKFKFSSACSGDQVWISRRGFTARSTSPDQPLVARPGFRAGRHVWKITVIAGAPGAQPSPDCSIERKSNTIPMDVLYLQEDSQPNSDYAVPWDAIQGTPGNVQATKPSICVQKPGKRVSSRNYGLSMTAGVCLRSQPQSSNGTSQGPKTLCDIEEAAAVKITISDAGASCSPKRSMSQHSPVTSLRSWLLSKRLPQQEISGQQPITDERQGFSTLGYEEAMVWPNGSMATLVADCDEGLLTVINHSSGEVRSLNIAAMVMETMKVPAQSLGENFDGFEPSSTEQCSQSCRQSNGTGAYVGMGDSFAHDGYVPVCGGQSLRSSLQSSCSPICKQACEPEYVQWLHPYFMLDNPNIVVMIVQTK